MKLTTKHRSGAPTADFALDQIVVAEDEAYWHEYLGDLLDGDEARQLLGLQSPRALDDLVAAHEILAVSTTRGMAFPRFQFVARGIDPTIARVIRIFSGVVATPYTTAAWLRGARFEDKSVAEWIASGEDPEVVIRAAEDSAARLAA